MNRARWVSVAIGLTAVVSGCVSDKITGAPALAIEIVGGDGQTGPVGAALPVPLRVRVLEYGVPTPETEVVWERAGGAAALLASPTSVTNVEGESSTAVSVGGAGEITVRASVRGDPSISATFRLTGITRGTDPVLVGQVGIPPNYGIHDTFVRDGLAFVSAWNTGLIIYDVGNGRAGGSPSRPVEISRIITADNGVPGGPAVHNAWWFHNPVSSEKRYVFVGQEGPSTTGAEASGDIHVVDVSDLAHPRETAFLHIPGAGAHNFWMDEARQILYAAYYNAGVIGVDVSGTLTGDLSNRIVARNEVGGPGNTFTWGVELAAGALWAIDMMSGLWKLDPITLQTLGGGHNVPEYWSSDLSVRGSYAYTGTWGGAPRAGHDGNTLFVWRIDGGAPTLASSIVYPNVRTVSDVQVSADGGLLAVTAERGAGQGLYVYRLTNPAHPAPAGRVLVTNGLHTGTVAEIGGRIFVFAAKNPDDPALQVYDITP